MKLIKNIGLFVLYLLLYILSSSLASSVIAIVGVPPVFLHILAISGFALMGLVFYLYRTMYHREEIEVAEVPAWMRRLALPLVLFIVLWFVQILFPAGNSNNQNVVISFIEAYPIYAFFQIVIFAPILEEYIFRGFVANLFFPKMRGMVSFFSFAAVSGLLFSLVHLPNNFVFFLIYFVMGFSLAWLYAVKVDLRYSIALHALNNFIAFIMIILSL